jgi:hypothetical protein
VCVVYRAMGLLSISDSACRRDFVYAGSTRANPFPSGRSSCEHGPGPTKLRNRALRTRAPRSRKTRTGPEKSTAKNTCPGRSRGSALLLAFHFIAANEAAAEYSTSDEVCARARRQRLPPPPEPLRAV